MAKYYTVDEDNGNYVSEYKNKKQLLKNIDAGTIVYKAVPDTEEDCDFTLCLNRETMVGVLLDDIEAFTSYKSNRTLVVNVRAFMVEHDDKVKLIRWAGY